MFLLNYKCIYVIYAFIYKVLNKTKYFSNEESMHKINRFSLTKTFKYSYIGLFEIRFDS
jgi:hypothetical protein